jgi:hypothetical protein
MAFIPYVGPRIIPNCVDVAVIMKAANQTIMNVWQVKYTAHTPTVADLQNLAAEVGSVWATIARPELSSQVQFIQVLCKDIGAAGRFVGAYNYPANTYGQNGSSDLPLNVAANVTLKTAKQGRRFTGKKSISGFTENHVDHNTLGVEILNFLANLAAGMIRTWVGGLFATALGSLPHMVAIGPPTPAETNVLTGITVPDAWTDSQKTRLTNRGN